MSQGTVGQLLVDTVVTIASPTTKHAAMVMALLKNPAEFVEEEKERTCSSMTFVKWEISVSKLFHESRYKTLFCFRRIQWLLVL
jgi:hypothetical protein